MTPQSRTIIPPAPEERHAAERKLIGTWKLESCFMEDVETQERSTVWGKHPNGRLAITPAGYWIVVQTAQARNPPQTDPDRNAAFRSMLAYSGRYRIEEQKIVIDVDISWDESWTRTEQVRHFRFEDDQLHIEAAPQRYPNISDKVMRAILIWRREE